MLNQFICKTRVFLLLSVLFECCEGPVSNQFMVYKYELVCVLFECYEGPVSNQFIIYEHELVCFIRVL